MRFSHVFLVFVAALCCCSVSKADASGTYAIKGSATMVGDVPMGCGSSTCLETFSFSALFNVTSDGGTLCGGPCYTTHEIPGSDVTLATGPLTGSWSVSAGDDQQGYFSLYTSTVELDLYGLYSTSNFLPASGSGYTAVYVCLDPACVNFDGMTWPGGYFGALGSWNATVTQTPEPIDEGNGFVALPN